MTKLPVIDIQDSVLDWYAANGRHELPWRNLNKEGIVVPYGVLISEFMLQQTQVERVIPKFNAFITDFPTIQSLASSSPAGVIMLWSGLGYNRRAIMLHNAAQAIVREYNGIVPCDYDALVRLPGIGPYTAAAIMAFGYNEPVVVLDTNIQRFYELLFFGYDRPKLSELTDFVRQFIPRDRSCEWHSGLMDLMSHIRTARSPREQQSVLIKELNINPTWPLPTLSEAPLKRPKQSTFMHSKRYYRGQIIAYLRKQKKYQATMDQVAKLLSNLAVSSEYPAQDLVRGLRNDRLIEFSEPLTADTIIRLP